MTAVTGREALLAAAIKKRLTAEYLADTVQLSRPDDESGPDWDWAAASISDWLAQELAEDVKPVCVTHGPTWDGE